VAGPAAAGCRRRPDRQRARDRVEANTEWAALIAQKKTELQTTLFTDGAIADSVTRWSALINSGASDLVDAATVTSESDAILAYTR
jgi:hypothetical protein